MKRQLVGLAVIAVVLASLFGCSQHSPIASNPSKTGEVQIQINLDKVGSLAKTAVINLDSLILVFTAPGEANIRRKTTLSGSGEQTINTTVALGAGKSWTVAASTFARDAAMGSRTVHQGTTTFSVIEGTNPPVLLTLSAQYSMLRVQISPMPDSATFVGLYPGSTITERYTTYDDTTFARKDQTTADTVKLFYDWLQVGYMPGMESIQVLIRGIWNGQTADLYWGTYSLPTLVAGADASYSFNLNWIGPASSTGQQPLQVTIGKVGTVVVTGIPQL